MTKIMYEIPSDPTIQSVLITEDCVRNGHRACHQAGREPSARSHSQRRHDFVRPLSCENRTQEGGMGCSLLRYFIITAYSFGGIDLPKRQLSIGKETIYL